MTPRRRRNESDETEASGTGTTALSGTTAATSPGSAGPRDPMKFVSMLEKPSKQEALNFYHAVPSRPRLIGRTSAKKQPWEGLTHGIYTTPPTRVLSPIGQHPILRYWEDAEPRIITAIGRLPWTSVDVLRIGHNHLPVFQRPVVVWVGVSHADTAWSEVVRALCFCRQILDDVDLTDVDVQIRRSEVVSLTKPPLEPPYEYSDMPEFSLTQPISTSLGQSIFPFADDSLQGTLGFYITAEGQDAPLWAVTCRHVGIPLRWAKGANQHYHRGPSSGSALLKIGLPATRNLEDALLAAYRAEERVRKELERAIGPRQAQKETTYEERKKIRATLVKFKPLEDRVIGGVHISPPIEMLRSTFETTGFGGQTVSYKGDWTRDWCIIALDKDKFKGELPRNAVDIRTMDQNEGEVENLLSPRGGNKHKFVFPDDGLIVFSGVIPMSEIADPMTLDAQGNWCCLVGKRGAVSGLTWGSPTGLRSTVRRVGYGIPEFTSKEWAIIGSLGGKPKSFSEGGDSGAAVFDVHGRLGGMVTAGAKEIFEKEDTDADEKGKGKSTEQVDNDNVQAEIDVTYVSPAPLLLADIQKQLGRKIKLL